MSEMMVPKLIGKRTKEGDRVFDGCAVFKVLHRVGDLLLLEPESADHHFYVRNIEGGSQRYSDQQAALNALCLPAVAAGVLTARSAR